MIKKFKHRFSRLFSDYLSLHSEESLADIAVLGNDLIQSSIPPEDIAEIFEESLNRYAQTVPEIRLGEVSDRITVPLVELLMSYGMAFRKQVYERRHLASKIIENTPEGIFMTNDQGNILIANPSFSAITGYAKDELIGINLSFLLRLDKIGAAPENIFHLTERGGGHWKGEITSRRKGGEAYRAVLNITAIRDGYGKVTDYVGILDDITEQKQREEMFRMELSRAKKIYDMVVRPDLPLTKWAEITVKCLPAENFGGDTLDIIAPSENSLLIFLADVTGHGVSAAMTANTLKTMFREISAATLSPAAVCSRLNRAMSKTILPDDIIAAFCALVDVKNMTLTYCLAGLPNPMIFRDNEIIRLTPTGMPLGVFEETNYHEKTIALHENDVLLAFTDGITEARNFRGEIFGLSGIEKSRPHSDLSPDPSPKRIGETPDIPHNGDGCSPPYLSGKGAGGLGLADAVLEGAIRFQNSLSFQDDLILVSMRVVRPHPLPATERGENAEYAMPLNSFHTERKSILTIETRYADIDSLIAGIMSDIRKKMVLEAEDQGKLTIALFESIANAIEHGNLELTEFRNDLKLQDAETYQQAYQERRNSPRYGDRRLMIEVYYGMEEIEISVADEGNGFDVSAVPDPTMTVNLDRPTGRGIYLLKKSADRVTYNSKGSKVTFFKKIRSQSVFEAGFSEIKDIRVLIVEDEQGVAEINRLMLEKSGYIVVGVAEDGQQALEMVKTRMPDVILMDYLLPDMDGLEITKHIQEIYPTPIVMLTAYSGEELSEKAYLSGIGAYLSKPIRLHEISQAITVSMARFNDIKELRRINIQLQTEIAKREQTETSLRQSQSKYRMMYEESSEGILLLDDNGIIIEGNPQLLQMLGYSPEELRGKKLIELIHPEDLKQIPFQLEPLLAGCPVHIERRIQKNDNSYIVVDATAKRISKNLIQAVFRDITQRRQAENALRQSEARYKDLYERQKRMEKTLLDYTEFLQTLLETIPMPIFYKNTSGVYLGCNKAYEDFFGTDKKHIIGKTEPLPRPLSETERGDLSLGPPPKQRMDELGDLPLPYMEGGRGVRSVKHADGSFREIEYHNALFSDNNGVVIGMIGVMSDITEIRQAQTLKMEALGQMAEDLAFKFGNMLQVIGGYAEIIMADISPKHTMYEDIKEILKTSEKAGDLVNQLRVFGRQHLPLPRTLSETERGDSIHPQNPPSPPLKKEGNREFSPFPTGKGAGGLGGQRILVAEDETSARRLIVNFLKKAGYQVIEACDGEKAIRIFKEHAGDIDLALLDVLMPKVNGKEVYDAIRASNPNIPVIFITGYDRDILESEHYEVIRKPCNPYVLLQKIRDALDICGNVSKS